MSQIELATNDTLNRLAVHVRNRPVDFASLARKKDKYLDESNAAGVYAERHVQSSIYDAITHAHIKKIMVSPIPRNAETLHYKFRRSKMGTGIIAQDLGTGNDKSEYNYIGVAQGLPFVVEVKTRSQYTRSGGIEAIETSQESIQTKLEPLQDFFNTNRFGYIAAGPRLVFRPTVQERFKSRGGIIVEFPMSRYRFKEGVLRTLAQVKAASLQS